MTEQVCPKCGAPKHPLKACEACGYSWQSEQKAQISKPRPLRPGQNRVPTTSISGYEACPRCGTQKHVLNACPSCGFRRSDLES